MKIIKANSNRYSISAMCQYLQVSRNTYYYEAKPKKSDSELERFIEKIFKDSRNNYGTRKIKHELFKIYNLQVSRRKISMIMRENALISSYTVKNYKHESSKVNKDSVENEVDRNFNNRERLEVVVSDLTYVNVKGKWNYICTLIDLYNREIVGFAASKNKDALLVENAFLSSDITLSDIQLFHTDRGSEFKNKLIDSLIKAFDIKRSLSKAGCPYDNAVAEAGFKIVKTEFVKGRIFESLEALKIEFFDYVNWYNNKRIHGSLNYETPVSYRELVSR